MKIAVHSFKGGTGKSNIVANLSVALASRGQSVGVFDLDLVAPGLHLIYGLRDEAMKFKFNNYLRNECSIEDMIIDLSKEMKVKKLLFVAASLDAQEIMSLFKRGYEVVQFNKAANDVANHYNLDWILVDTHPGLMEATLLALASCDEILTVMRDDTQHYTGTMITLEVTGALHKPTSVILNFAQSGLPESKVRSNLQNAFKTPVLAVMPFDEELMTSASKGGIFIQDHPYSPFTKRINELADHLMAKKESMER